MAICKMQDDGFQNVIPARLDFAGRVVYIGALSTLCHSQKKLLQLSSKFII